MYSQDIARDIKTLVKALVSNQLARFAPSHYVRLTRQTGRADRQESAEQISDYFNTCFTEYLEQLGIHTDKASDYLTGKTVLEYGPGNMLGVALLMYAFGANRVFCVDRFPLQTITEESINVYKLLMNKLSDTEKLRANSAFNSYGDPSSGFDNSKIRYSVSKNGLIENGEKFDLIISRSVMEHVSDLPGIFANITSLLKNNGISVHKVDLKSHGLDRYLEFDFLTWSFFAYRVMYGHKGFPNRWRIDRYLELIGKNELKIKLLSPTGLLEAEKVRLVQPYLAKPFRNLPVDDLAWLGFWIVLEHA